MNLDEQLRAALNLEAEMVQTPIPNAQNMIKGGQDRRRRRHAAWAGGGVLAAVVVAGGLYVVAGSGGDPDSTSTIANTPTESVSTSVTPSGPPLWSGTDKVVDVEPGTYRLFVGVRPDFSGIEADLTLGTTGWRSANLPVFMNDAEEPGGAGVQLVERLVGEADYCDLTGGEPGWSAASRTAATTSRALARQFAVLPRGTVVEPITSTRAFGHEAFHLRVRVDGDCGEKEGAYHLFSSSTQALSIDYRVTPRAVRVVDLLVVDLDGTPVVAYYWYAQGADPGLVAEVSSVRDSIEFVPAT